MTLPATTRSSARVAVVLVVLTVLAYANTFRVPFLFDDIGAITQNTSIEGFTSALRPPDALSVTGRPLVNLSLALNHAISGRAVWSYHVLNLTLHLTCALLLFDLIRRTLRARSDSTTSLGVAAAAATLWSLHPLQTAAVTYVMQRSELLVSFFCLLTLYGFVRALPGNNRSTGKKWLLISVVACGLGMAAKEVMVTAPLLVLLYDRTFVARSFRAALAQRRIYYGALATTWLLLAALVFGTDNRGGSAGLAAAISWSDYALTQILAITHYLQLVVWPNPLVFDYGTTLIHDADQLIASALVLLAILLAIGSSFRRWPAVAFCGAWFFVLIAPSSSVVPIATQTLAEHRIYLALAAPILLSVVALHQWFGRRFILICAAAALLFATGTFARNGDYASAADIWRDTVYKRPQNARAHYNHGLALWAVGNDAGARAEFLATVQLEPTHGLAHLQLGRLTESRETALIHLETATRLLPHSAPAHYETAVSLLVLRRTGDALPYLTAAIQLDPRHAPAHYNLGTALAALGRYRDALAHFDEASRLDPEDRSARDNAAKLRVFLNR